MEQLADGSLLRALTEIAASCPIFFIYLCEAHALDSWPLSHNAPPNHRSLCERRLAATSFLTRWPALQGLIKQTLIDNMDDRTTVELGLWPERFLFLQGGKVAWASSLTEEGTEDLASQLLAMAHSHIAN